MSFTNLKYHIVFSTKKRQPLLDDAIQPRLIDYVGGIARNLKGILIEAGGPRDHVHLVVGIHPSVSVSDFVRNVKANSTTWVHQTFTSQGIFAWQNEYSAFTVSESQLPSVIRYVQNQAPHHATMSFEEELRVLLKKHRIPFEERYLTR